MELLTGKEISKKTTTTVYYFLLFSVFSIYSFYNNPTKKRIQQKKEESIY